MLERFTDTVAVAGVTSWLWTEQLNNSILVPAATFLGIIWLILQIYFKVEERNRKHDEKDSDRS